MSHLPDDGLVVAVGSETTLTVYDLASGEHLAAVGDAHAGQVRAVTVGRDGDGRMVLLSGGEDGVVRGWHLDGELVPAWTSAENTGAVAAVAVGALSDGSPVAVAGDEQGRVRVYGLADGGQLREFGADEHYGKLSALATGDLAPDGSAVGQPVVVTASHDDVFVWDLTSGALLADDYGVHKRTVFGVAVSRSPTGRAVFASVGGDDHISIEDLATGESLVDGWVWGRQQWGNAIAAVELTGGVRGWVTGGEDDSLRLWTVTGEPLGPPLLGHRDRVEAVAAGRSPDGQAVVVSVGEDGCRVWELAGDWIAGAEGARDTWWGHGDGRGRRVGSDPSTNTAAEVTSLATAIAGDGTPVIISGGTDGTGRVWTMADGLPVGQPLAAGAGAVVGVAALRTPDGRTLVAHLVDEYRPHLTPVLRVHDLETGAPYGEPVRWPGRSARALAAARLPDGRQVLVVGFTDEGVQLLTPDGAPAGTPFAGTDGGHPMLLALAVDASPDGRYTVATGHGGGQVAVWDLASRHPLAQREFTGSRTVWAVGAGRLADGRRALVTSLSGRGNAIDVWSLDEDRPLCPPLVGHRWAAEAVAVITLPDGSSAIASVSGDATLRLWDPPTGHQLTTIELPARATCLAPAGDALVVGTTLGLLRVDLH